MNELELKGLGFLNMSKLMTTFMLVIFILLAVGTFALMTMSIPAPSHTVERELPDDTFPR